MFKRLKNRRAELLSATAAIWLVSSVIAITAGRGLIETAANGTLQNNMKVIACKVGNNGEEFCNNEYNYTPKVEEVAVKKGGKLRAKLLAMQHENKLKKQLLAEKQRRKTDELALFDSGKY